MADSATGVAFKQLFDVPGSDCLIARVFSGEKTSSASTRETGFFADDLALLNNFSDGEGEFRFGESNENLTLGVTLVAAGLLLRVLRGESFAIDGADRFFGATLGATSASLCSGLRTVRVLLVDGKSSPPSNCGTVGIFDRVLLKGFSGDFECDELACLLLDFELDGLLELLDFELDGLLVLLDVDLLELGLLLELRELFDLQLFDLELLELLPSLVPLELPFALSSGFFIAKLRRSDFGGMSGSQISD